MTTREFYTTVLSVENLPEELATKAQELISALDAKNAKRKTTPTKEQKEAAARVQAVLDFFYDHQGTPFTRDKIAEALGITPGQVTAACKGLVAENMVIKSEAKIDKSKKVVYTMPHEE